MVWPVQYIMIFVCMLTPQLDDVDLCKHMRITLITLAPTRWYYISYLQMTNANDPLLKLLASAPLDRATKNVELLIIISLTPHWPFITNQTLKVLIIGFKSTVLINILHPIKINFSQRQSTKTKHFTDGHFFLFIQIKSSKRIKMTQYASMSSLSSSFYHARPSCTLP